MEAQSLAIPLGLSISDIDLGLGCIYRYRGNYDQARTHLNRALQTAQSPSQWDQLNANASLANLAMASWDSQQPDPSYADALLVLAPNLPQGSNAAFAEALLALHAYDKTPNNQSQAAVHQALTQLDLLDAQRKRVFIASHAAELALQQNDGKVALSYGEIAHQAANIVEHISDVAVAHALCVLSATLLAEDKLIAHHWQRLQTLPYNRLSVRAQRLITQAKQTLKR